MKITEEQLKKVVFADLSNYDPITNTYIIKKYSKPVYNIGKCYLVRLSQEIINNTNSILATNWNNNRAPKFEYYKVYVNKALGKMIQVDSIAFDFEHRIDLNDMFSGWLDTEKLTQISEI